MMQKFTQFAKLTVLAVATLAGAALSFSSTAVAQDAPPQGSAPLQGGAFSLDQFESAQFNEKAKVLQAKKSRIRLKSIAKLEDLLQKNPYYERKADVYFRLAEGYWEEQKYQYLLSRERYESEYDKFQDGVLKVEPEEPQENYDQSLGYYRNILQQFPDYGRIDEVIYYLGRGALKSGKERNDRLLTKEGVGHFQKLVQNYPRSRFVAESHLALAEHYFNNNSLYYAKTNYEKIITNFKSSGMFNYALYKLGWVYFNLAEFEKSVDTFHQVVDIVGSGDTRGMVEFKEQALNDLIICYAEIDDGWKDARKYYIDEIGEKAAYDKLLKLANLYVGQDKDDEAVALYSHFIEYDKKDKRIPEFYDNILSVLAKANDFPRTEARQREMIKFFDTRNTWYEANNSNKEEVKAAMTLKETNLLVLANHYHKQAEKTNAKEAYLQASKDYAYFLELFPDSKHAYFVNAYYADILYDPLENYGGAIEQYSAVIKRDKKGEYVEDAALGIIYCYEALMAQKGLKDGGKEKKVKVVKLSADQIKKRQGPIERTDLHELERGFVDASDQYVSLLSDLMVDPEVRKKNPERGEKIPEVMFISAQVFYEHGQFAQAIKRLKTLFDYDQEHEYAAYAVNTMLDCYVRLRYWDEIDTWATKLIDAKNFKVKKKSQLNKIRAMAKGEKARDLTAEKKFDAAIDENMSVYKEFKRSSPEIASKALYNVGAIHAGAKRLPKAIKTYKRVTKEFSKEEIAPIALFTIGEIYESQTQFKKAAETFESMTKFPKHEMTPDAVFNAGLIREAIGDYSGAISSYKKYLKTFKKAEDRAELELQIGRVYELMDTTKGLKSAVKHFEKYAKKYRKDPEQAARVVEALSRAGIDLKKLNKKKNRRKATKILNDCISSFNAMGEADNSAVCAFAAQAKFELVEYIYDDFFAVEIKTRNFKTLKKTLTEKAEKQQEAVTGYFEVLEFKSGGVSSGALFRIGKLFYDFSATLFNVPIPEDLPIEVQDEYIFALEKMAAPIQEKSLSAFVQALRFAQEKKVYNEWSKSAAEYASKVNPDEFPISSEPAAQPIHSKDTLLSTNFIRSLRQGDIEVQMIEMKEETLTRRKGTK
jgi:TolA-binding protein